MTSHWNLSSVVGKEFVEIIFPNFHQIFLSTPPVRSKGGRDVSQIPGVVTLYEPSICFSIMRMMMTIIVIMVMMVTLYEPLFAFR